MRVFHFVSTFTIVGIIFTIVSFYNYNNKANGPLYQTQMSSKQTKQLYDSSIIPTLSLTLTNEYNDNFEYYPFDYIAQVLKKTVFKVEPSVNYDDAVYLWTIDGSIYSGQEVEHTFTTVGWKDVGVKMIYDSDNSEVTATFRIASRYVRREIRSLTNEDREAFLDAMQTVFYTPTKEGKEIYGDKFRGIDHFVTEHLHGSAQKTCDHWHDDAGVVTHHTSITLEFENALRVINPSVSVPYWDYTLDEYIYGVDWEDSVLFSNDWFSEASPDNDDHIITEGRWAYLPIFKGDNNTYPITNAHGLLRSPWNLNPTAYVTRHNKVLRQRPYKHLPTCRSFVTAFDEDWIGNLNNDLNGYLHGPAHIMIGGHVNIFNENRLINKYLGLSVSSVLLISKNLWRLGYVRCPESCEGESEKSCQCSCPENLRQNMTAYEILNKEDQIKFFSLLSNGLIEYDSDSGHYVIDGLTHDEQQEVYESLFDSFCSFGYPGEMFTSASPSDPTFWLIHPTAERFLQLRRFSSYYGNHTLNETWGYYHTDVNPSDFERVCSWDDVSDDEMPKCVYASCYGHNADDLLPQTDLVPGHKTFTNQEFYDFMDPRNEDYPYVYDNFDFQHCTEQGEIFDF